jgi:Integral membrane protein possibly involved in chromosome condensation
VADHTDPISAPPVDPDIVEPAPRALHVRPWAIAAVAAGVVMFHGVSRDIQLNRGCRILRRLHHVQHRRVETIRLIQRRRYWAGMANAVGTLLVTVTAAAAGLAVAGL